MENSGNSGQSMDTSNCPIKIIIAGGRFFNDYSLVKSKLNRILSNQKNVEIVCGMAKGADLLGKKYSEEFGYGLAKFPSKWDDLTEIPCKIKTRKDGSKYNVLAGINRNRAMAEYADALVCFWDGESSGSKNMIDTANELGLKVRIIRY